VKHVFEGFYEDLARQNTAARLFQLQLGFRRCRIWVSVIVVVSQRPLFRTPHGLLGVSALIDLVSTCLSVCLQPCLSPVCPSLSCRSDWLANPIVCASFPGLTPPFFVDSLDSELWCGAAALASSSTPRLLGNLFGSFSPRGARSKGDQQPDG
jgi:hypothetical protein